MKDVIIAIPVYRQELRWYEQLSLARCFEVLGSYPIVFIAPEGATLDYGPEYRDVPRVTFPAQYFESVDGYSALLLSTTFYQRFRDFRKLLIYQLDAFVFSDQLMDFVAMDYDWIGAPWFLGCHWDFGDWNRKLGIRKTFPVGGNGGFCLRDIQSCLRVLETYGDGSALGGNLAEDRVFCYYFHIDPAFRLAPIRVMYAFSSEFDAERVWYKNGCRLPFGCHDWTSMSATFYLWAFRQVGYDLRGARAGLHDVDLMTLEVNLRHWRERHLPRAERRADLPLRDKAAWLESALARQDVYAAGKAVFFAEHQLLHEEPQPGEAYLLEHLDALLYRGVLDIEQGRYGEGIRYLKAWDRIAYRYGIARWPELYLQIARAYRACGMEPLARLYEELQRES
ncbi:DUF5672 family protein [uncultured Selenomonas sp.]|uniref:DUF5672 family protein n=1 Tax=uncultured Selenomonas sp. TaxID=159275 RepID=UPI0025EBEDE9|nr:DUF5672 family protein [uncultured Selenomonas sp.]MDY6269136.1 DUF5672 family protein [Selenomonadaceae bacterium]